LQWAQGVQVSDVVITDETDSKWQRRPQMAERLRLAFSEFSAGAIFKLRVFKGAQNRVRGACHQQRPWLPGLLLVLAHLCVAGGDIIPSRTLSTWHGSRRRSTIRFNRGQRPA